MATRALSANPSEPSTPANGFARIAQGGIYDVVTGGAYQYRGCAKSETVAEKSLCSFALWFSHQL
jgi:hypothetical protein